MHENSRLIFEKFAANYFAGNARVLEIGPDLLPSTFQKLRRCKEWHTLDIRNRSGLTYFAESEYTFPVSDAAYDIVFSASVMEHIREVWTWTKELARVCKAGGRVITIVPTSWPYHEAPVDCWRVYPEAIGALYKYAGLEMELCVNCSLEECGKAWRIPGRSLNYCKEGLSDIYKKNMESGGPCECAYDTVAIGRKV